MRTSEEPSRIVLPHNFIWVSNSCRDSCKSKWLQQGEANIATNLPTLYFWIKARCWHHRWGKSEASLFSQNTNKGLHKLGYTTIGSSTWQINGLCSRTASTALTDTFSTYLKSTMSCNLRTHSLFPFLTFSEHRPIILSRFAGRELSKARGISPRSPKKKRGCFYAPQRNLPVQ